MKTCCCLFSAYRLQLKIQGECTSSLFESETVNRKRTNGNKKGYKVNMISFEKAKKIILDSAVHLDKEYVPLQEACGRILSEDVASDVDMPPFNKSAMDGYACRREDLDKPLRVIETVAAGYSPEKTIGPGECAKIMTGGIVPEGADCVVMVEHTEFKDDFVHVLKKSTATNICYQAEDIKTGDVVLPKGKRITPADIAILASAGCVRVPTARKPVLGVVATGSELVEPSRKPEAAQIRNSNSYQLCSQIEQAGCVSKYFGIAEDTPEAIRTCIENLLPEIDILLVSGGVSMGDYDYVPGILKEVGFDLLFEKVAIKPGKPTVFGKKGNTFVFGMPGNPVSTFMIFELLVKPFCYKMMGGSYSPVKIPLTLGETIKRKKSDRLSYIPVVINENGVVQKVSYHGSAHIHALTRAHGYIPIPVGVNRLNPEERVEVTLLP